MTPEGRPNQIGELTKLAFFDGNWSEDYPHENGNYFNHCVHCKCIFLGHKRRVVCKRCTEEKQETASVTTEKMYPLSVVKAAFEVFHYRGFPHNEPTWEQWLEAMDKTKDQTIQDVKETNGKESA